MKSIDDTLKIIRDITNAIPVKFDMVLIGGAAVILHGVERTTIDVDFCVYSNTISETNSSAFYDNIVKHLPKRFSAKLVRGSKIPDDPLKHDIIFIDDTEGEYERIDLLIAQYKWEMEGIEKAVQIQSLPFPVMGKPYLVAMKLLASSYKDAHDVVTLYGLMSDDEKEKTRELAKRIGRDKKLERLLFPPPEEEVRENPEEYIS
jgi:hypothetical protein